MAGCDYYSCDVCGSKCFYDAEVNYQDYRDMGRLGDIKAICGACAETHRIVILENKPLSTEERQEHG